MKPSGRRCKITQKKKKKTGYYFYHRREKKKNNYYHNIFPYHSIKASISFAHLWMHDFSGVILYCTN